MAKAHAVAICCRPDVHNRTQAVALAQELNILCIVSGSAAPNDATMSNAPRSIVDHAREMLGNYGATIQLAESVLSDTFGSPVRLSVIDKFDSRHPVLRCKLEAASDNVPASVVLKQFAVDAPPEQQPHPLGCLANELSSLRFLGQQF